MKNNISYYQHQVNSHEHWKFKTLRRKYTWAGEGKFWALNNMIAASEGCVLDLSSDDKLTSIATDLDFDATQFMEFVDYLINTCKLIQIPIGNDDFPIGKKITTSIVQENWAFVSEKRIVDRERKHGKQKSNSEWNNDNSDRKVNNSDRKVVNFHTENTQSKVKESKGKEIVCVDEPLKKHTHTTEGEKLNGTFNWIECTRQLVVSDTYKPNLLKKYMWAAAVFVEEMHRFVLHVEGGSVKKPPANEKETIAQYEKFLLNSHSNPSHAKN